MPQIKLGNLSFYYEVYGKGKPLLLIAGLGSDSASWATVVKELSLPYQTIIFDNRSCGRSDKPKRSYSISDMAQDAVKLLDGLKIKSAHIIGHSMGGYIAQELAITYPKRVDKLILESTAAVSSSRNNILFDDFARQLSKNDDYAAWIRRWTFWSFSRQTFTKRDFIERFIKYAVRYPYRQKAQDFARQGKAIALFDARERVKKIKAKTLVIEGEDDILIIPQEVKALAESITASKFELLKNTGHSIHVENPELFVKKILSFLQD